MVLELVYEQDFLCGSFGFRPRRSAHQALQYLRTACMNQRLRWVIDIDIVKYFDSIPHSQLRNFLDQRVTDGVIRRMINKWLKAGVLEDGALRHATMGSPQGGVVSPCLSNIFLHHVLDEWFEHEVRPRLKCRCTIVRFADDAVMAFENNLDAKRVYVTGLSAGGAMTSVMLATYPEVFAGGGIVAGLPYGCAKNPTPWLDAVDAAQCMTSGRPLSLPAAGTGFPTAPGTSPMPMPIPPAICQFNPFLCPPSSGSSGFTAAQLGDFVRQASSHAGPWPNVSIWHGSADTTVNPVNENEEMLQWTNVHGVSSTPTVKDTVKGVPHQAFKDASGDAVVETFTITGMSHGVPIDPGTAGDQCGTVDQYVIDANICSSFFIAKFWGLVP